MKRIWRSVGEYRSEARGSQASGWCLRCRAGLGWLVEVPVRPHACTRLHSASRANEQDVARSARGRRICHRRTLHLHGKLSHRYVAIPRRPHLHLHPEQHVTVRNGRRNAATHLHHHCILSDPSTTCGPSHNSPGCPCHVGDGIVWRDVGVVIPMHLTRDVYSTSYLG